MNLVCLEKMKAKNLKENKMINPEEFTTVNITLKVENKKIVGLEDFLNKHFDLISFEFLTDTDKMYQEDKEFKKLVKLSSDLKKKRLEYISKNNHKYK